MIGGQAVLLYGEPRLTRDIDVTLGATLDRLANVQRAIGKAGLAPLVDPNAFPRETMVLPCHDPETGVRVDFIFSSLPYEQVAIERGRCVTMGDAEVNFVSPEDLVVLKTVAGRPRDLEDVRSILLKNPDLDLSYIRHWLSEFGAALGQAFQDRLNELLEDCR